MHSSRESNTDVLLSQPKPGIAIVTLNRPRKLNALTQETVAAVLATFSSLRLDQSVRAVILTGAGRAFCSGHDINDVDEQDPAVASVQTAYDVQEMFAAATKAIAELPQPVIAAVNGPAIGDGLALALAADTRVCNSTALFGLPFIRAGVSGCDMGVSYFLPRVVSPTLAFEMMLTGRFIDANEAYRSGLVLRIVDDVLAAALTLAESIAVHSPFGVRLTKQIARAGLDAPSLDAALAMENRTQIMASRTADHREAIDAIRDKRPGEFKNV